MQNETPLKDQKCEDIKPGSKPMIIPAIESHVAHMDGWEVPLNYLTLKKTFKFKNYHQTLSFVNAVSWIAHKEDHHPEVCFGYNECKISLTTHSVKGLTQNDFIVAAKIDALLD